MVNDRGRFKAMRDVDLSYVLQQKRGYDHVGAMHGEGLVSGHGL